LIVNNFLSDFATFRKYCDGLDYQGEVNPTDGVMYPGISRDIPRSVKTEVFAKLNHINPIIEDPWLFLRLSTERDKMPHQAHNDLMMGRKRGMILYLCRKEHCKGGTSFVRHIDEGMENGVTTPHQEQVWEQDHNNYDKWEIISLAEMQPNRAFIFETQQMHRAELPSTFGYNAFDGRLVMVAFW